jgi:hypothetical protein
VALVDDVGKRGLVERHGKKKGEKGEDGHQTELW